MMVVTPFRNRTYRVLFSAQIAALVGTGLSTVALALLAYDLAGDDAGLVLGTALAIKMLAYVGLSPWAGSLARRLPRRRLLVGLDLARAGAMACLPFVTAIWEIYILIFLISACAAAFTPTFQATIPDVLTDDRDYTRALTLSRLAYDLENLLSPALAGLALLWFSYDALFAANAGAFLVSAALVMSVALPAAAPADHDRRIASDITFGIRAYLATPRLRGLLALSWAVAAAGAMVIVNTVVYVRDVLGLGEAATAMAFAAAGAGSMAIALSLPRLLDRVSDRSVMLVGAVSLATGLAAGLAAPGFAALLAIWFALGAGSSLIQTPAGRLLRRSAGPVDRPAYYAAQFALSHACWLVAYPAAGVLVATIGFAPTFAFFSASIVVAVATTLRIWPVFDPDYRDHTHEPFAHEHLHEHDEHHQHRHEGWEGPAPHRHPHRHAAIRHSHAFVIDAHHPRWPRATS